jgi:hypothetical protein
MRLLLALLPNAAAGSTSTTGAPRTPSRRRATPAHLDHERELLDAYDEEQTGADGRCVGAENDEMPEAA